MKTKIEQFKHELFRKNAIPQNSDNEKWFYQIVDDTIEWYKKQIDQSKIATNKDI